MKILCIYATRQIDSNLFMSSTKFDGLQQCGYHVDMVFYGPSNICRQFGEMYAHYFNNVFYLEQKDSALQKKMLSSEKSTILYNYMRGYILDLFLPALSSSEERYLKNVLTDSYDCILSFIPIGLSGFIANLVHKRFCPSSKVIQFWTDPISFGRCNSIDEIPKSRFLHRIIEKKVLGLCDKAVCCYPLFAEALKKLYPLYAGKVTWGDTSYIKHEKANFKPNNKRITIGSFGAYQARVRNVQPLLAAMKFFPDVTFIFRGDTDITIDESKYPNLDVEYGRKPIQEIEEMEANCDILLSIGGNNGMTIPAGKTLYYADYDKPILYISDGVHRDAASDYIKSFGRYEVCNNEEMSIVAGLRRCIESLPNFKLEIPDRLKPDVIARKIVE